MNDKQPAIKRQLLLRTDKHPASITPTNEPCFTVPLTAKLDVILTASCGTKVSRICLNADFMTVFDQLAEELADKLPTLDGFDYHRTVETTVYELQENLFNTVDLTDK